MRIADNFIVEVFLKGRVVGSTYIKGEWVRQ
jgi:hypothetical protein